MIKLYATKQLPRIGANATMIGSKWFGVNRIRWNSGMITILVYLFKRTFVLIEYRGRR